jgi:hypothetical protein
MFRFGAKTMTVCLMVFLGTSLSQAEDLRWHTDYGEARDAAKRGQAMLLIYFYSAEEDAATAEFERHTLADPTVRDRLEQYVLLKLPLTATVQVDGQAKRLIEHAAFQYMYGRAGIAVIDHQSKQTAHSGHVVSMFPFSPGSYFAADKMRVILDLPPGTLTQRTLIYAVRRRREQPRSAAGTLSGLLAEASGRHSELQASMQSQGHHDWSTRFHQLNAKLPRSLIAVEVCAESWPGQQLVPAAEECVYSWRRSSGHWDRVAADHPLYAYDMKRGANGVWYATGIFGSRR